MNRIELKSYAKINLSLDVKGLREDGMHLVEMVMQQILLCDDITMEWNPVKGEKFEISLSTNRRYLPTDERNLAYKAALEMREFCREEGGPVPEGKLDIRIKKRIPVAAGLAGGSGNGAAVLHGLNILWGLELDVESLCGIGKKLGSDVPFCIMGQAAENENLKGRFRDDPLACHCALATGTGTELKPLPPLRSHLVLSKPAEGVSTAGVYKGIDSVEIKERPDTREMIRGLSTKDRTLIKKNMINVLENYTLKEYSTVVYTKNKMQELCGRDSVLMSGSGPTVFALTDSRDEAKSICSEMKEVNRESYWTRTTC
ncbi:MAG: 4-(cytidine 5'-diphospho)-2-C-methyl-D-erythritol kinase [Lentihominibacter sp.]